MTESRKRLGLLLGLAIVAGAASGCGPTLSGPGVVTPIPGPVYMDLNGNPLTAVSIGGRHGRGGPCLQGPVCLLAR